MELPFAHSEHTTSETNVNTYVPSYLQHLAAMVIQNNLNHRNRVPEAEWAIPARPDVALTGIAIVDAIKLGFIELPQDMLAELGLPVEALTEVY
jgi:hypothetical protein